MVKTGHFYPCGASNINVKKLNSSKRLVRTTLAMSHN